MHWGYIIRHGLQTQLIQASFQLLAKKCQSTQRKEVSKSTEACYLNGKIVVGTITFFLNLKRTFQGQLLLFNIQNIEFIPIMLDKEQGFCGIGTPSTAPSHIYSKKFESWPKKSLNKATLFLAHAKMEFGFMSIYVWNQTNTELIDRSYHIPIWVKIKTCDRIS